MNLKMYKNSLTMYSTGDHFYMSHSPILHVGRILVGLGYELLDD